MPAVVNCSGKNRKSELRLLLAEDDPDLSLRLKRYLGKQGFAVDAVHNGVDAEFNGREMPYDAIVLDLGLPQRSGLEVLANWRKAEVKTPVLILTARDSWQEKVQGLQQGADDYLTKPFGVTELLARVRNLLRLKQETDRRIAREAELLQLTDQLGRLNEVLRELAQSPAKLLCDLALDRQVGQVLGDVVFGLSRGSDSVADLSRRTACPAPTSYPSWPPPPAQQSA